ncbi:MAG: DUF177 domain-containing protein [Ramlibacter sp.]|nr:DUF177 domain-containing protein [Ramlibacter sp.]
MKKEFVAGRLDVVAFAQDGARLDGLEPLRSRTRLLAETQGLGADLGIRWSAVGELRPKAGAEPEVWLHLSALAVLPLTCQRCLGPVDVPLEVERSFRFVADEETASVLDDESEEDLLAISRSFDLHELVEDELLMEMPPVPRHDQCPTEVKLAAADEAFEAQEASQPNPFAVLQKLKTDKRN